MLSPSLSTGREGHSSPQQGPRLSSHSYRQAIGGPLIDKYRKPGAVVMKEKAVKEGAKPKPVGLFKLFRYATCLDVCMILVGFIAAFLHGAAFPIAMNVFGDITNLFVNHDITRGVANSEALPCPNSTIPIFINLTSITGGQANCSETLNFGLCNNFMLQDVITNVFGTQAICQDNMSFIDGINIQVYAFIAIAVLAFIFAWIHVWLFQTAAERQTHKIRLTYYQAILKQNIGWFDLNSTGELASRLSSGLDKIHKGIGDNLSMMIQWTASFVAALAVGFYRQWQLALFLCAIIPFMVIAAAVFGRLGAIFSSREEKSYAAAGGVAQEVLSSIRTVLAFGGQKRESDRYNTQLAAAKRQGVFKGISLGSIVGVIYFLIFLFYSISFWFGGFLVAEGLGEAGDIITVFFAILIGSMSIGQAGPNFIRLAEALGAAGDVYSTIDRPLTIDSSSETGLKPEKFEPTIELKNVHFTYPARQDIQILQGIDLHVEVGQTIALVGSSGSGKSTVVDLIQRFYEPDSGEVLIGGHNVKDLNVKWLRSQIGLVSQEPVLFDTTIAENIRYGKEDATMEEIEEAAKSANAHDFVSSLPNGYDTSVGEGGAQLSGGQKQRIAIARALVRDPKILLLDEATSALDSVSEQVVQNALDGACVGRTTIIIAHRLSTIQNADLIVGLDKGCVVEKGNHAELVAKKGMYYDLVMAQSYTADFPSNEIARYVPRTSKSLRSKSWRNRSMPRSFRRVRSVSTTIRRVTTRRRKSHQDVPESGNATELDVVERESRSDKREPQVEVVRKTKYGEIDDEEEDLPDVSTWRILKNLTPSHWIVIAIGVFLSIINGLIIPSFAIVFGEALQVFSGPTNEILNNIHPWGAAFLALGIALAVSSFIKTVCFSVTGENLTTRVRSVLFRAMLRQDIGWYDDERNSTASLSTKLSFDAGQMHGAAGVRIGTLLETVTSLLAAVAVAFGYSWITAIVILVFMPVLALGSALHYSLAGGQTKSSNKGLKEASEIAIESMANIRTVASFGLEDKFYQSFKKEVEGVYKFTVCLTVLYGLTFAFAETLIFFGYIITFRFGAYLVTLPTNDVLYTEYQNVFRVFAALVFGAVAIGAASSFVPDYSKAKKSAKIVYVILDREPEIDNFSEDGEKLDKVRGEIEFSGVFFAYPQRLEVNVFSGLELAAKPGQTIALVGTSGGGKSTVLSLIERFYDPHGGFIALDGVNTRDINVQWLRSQVGIVSQEPVLFDGTIADNIRYGALFRDVSDEEVIDAAKSANIHSFIETLPMGYNTNVGAKGAQLSGGQKQRVAIARALLRDPKVLLLDEATSALDTESEKVVQEALDKAREGRTSIVIAHRLSTIYNSDLIAVLKRGKVVELGTHSELLAKKGLYYKLNRAQLKDWKDEAKEEDTSEDVVQIEIVP